MSFLWIPKSIRHRTEYSFSMKMWNCRLTASQTDDSHTVVVGISDKYLTDLKVQKRWEHEHRSATSLFLKPAAKGDGSCLHRP